MEHGYPIAKSNAPVAQLDRAMVSGTIGRGFESSRAHHLNYALQVA